MAGASKAPDLLQEIKNWIYGHFGFYGLAAIGFLLAAFYLYSNWDKVKSWPWMPSLRRRFSQKRVPKADPQRFAVMVAHLENDEKREHERLIVEALKEFEGVQVLHLDRSIALTGAVPEEMERRPGY